MGRDVLLAAGRSVATGTPAQPVKGAGQPVWAKIPVQGLDVPGQEADNRSQIRAGPIPLDVGITQTPAAPKKDGPVKTGTVDLDPGRLGLKFGSFAEFPEVMAFHER